MNDMIAELVATKVYTQSGGEILGGGHVFGIYGPNGTRLYPWMTNQNILNAVRRERYWIGQFRYW